ncbi:MAG TPA: hypothetical protein PKI93_07225 [Alphaproteobacteria bacterium]|nr:hypothetical protein [Alphaproteobacteria bacterium]HNS43885.1 hypothetical protein [Alphaproteobacteria bacterium]
MTTQQEKTLRDQWYDKAQAPASQLYELGGHSAETAKEAIQNQRVRSKDLKLNKLDIPQTIVFLARDHFQAVAQFPVLYALKTGSNEYKFYAEIPTSYNRKHIPPMNGRKIKDENELRNLQYGLFANGHSTPLNFCVSEDEDTGLPEDFNPEKHIFHHAPNW